jgi:hypothetical protein
MENTNAYYLVGGMAGGLVLGVGGTMLWTTKVGDDKTYYGSDGKLFNTPMPDLKPAPAVVSEDPSAPPAGGRRRRRTKRSKRHGHKKSSRR